MLNPTDNQMTLRKGQKVVYALPAKSEIPDLNVEEKRCSQEVCRGCQNGGVDKIEGRIKSVASSINSEATMSSGRSFFPGKEELKQPDVLPDLSELEDKLTTKQLQKLRSVLLENSSVFAKNKADMGRCNLIEHRIDLEPDAIPHHEGARRMASWKAAQANEEVRHLLSLNLIEPSYSPWACGVVMAKKKGNQLRFCCDFRFLNAKTIRDAYPLPRIDESITRLGCACYFTTLDLGSTFWQVPLREEDRPKTAFACELGLFQWKVMPFGLSNATATFQRLMSKVLMDVAQSYGNLVRCYVDDVIIATSTIDQHIDRISEVLSCLRRAGLKCKPSKCELKTSIKYLGRIIDGEGVKPDPESIQTVMQWKRPRNKRELQSFLGFANYYREFIRGHSELVEPMNRLVKKNQDFQWTLEAEESFELTKKKLCSATVLALPREEGTFILDTDASDVAISGVLHQE